jgi:hypothetical protein
MKLKLLSALIVMLLLSAFARAQSGSKIAISVGPEFSFPFNTSTVDNGNIKDFYKDGIGGSVKIELPISAALHFTGSAGYVDYKSNHHYIVPYQFGPYPGPADVTSTNGALAPPYKFIPIKVGLQYYFVKCLYINGEVGDAIKTGAQAINSFIYAGGLGAALPFGPHQGLDIGVLYQRGFKTIDYDSPMSEFTIRVAYKYRF